MPIIRFESNRTAHVSNLLDLDRKQQSDLDMVAQAVLKMGLVDLKSRYLCMPVSSRCEEQGLSLHLRLDEAQWDSVVL